MIKRLIGNALGLIVFLFLVQWAISLVPAVAATVESTLSKLIPLSTSMMNLAPLSWPTIPPGDPRDNPPPAEQPPVQNDTPSPTPTPEVTPPDVPTPVVTPDPSVEPAPEPSPAPSIEWVCPIVGEGGC